MLSSLQKYFFSLHQKLLGFSLHIVDEISKLLTWLSIASNIYFISDFIFFIFWQLIFNYFSFTSNCSLLMISYFFSLRLQGKCFVQFSYVSFNETFFHEHFLVFRVQVFVSLGRFIPRYFILFDVMINGIVFEFLFLLFHFSVW